MRAATTMPSDTWNKTIELVALDLPQTVKANQERGVKFVLPDSPNHVVMNW